MNASKSAVGVNSLCNALQTMGSRLTHLYLAHNRLAGIPQIVGILSVSCAVFHPFSHGLLASVLLIPDALPESNVIGSLECDHSGHITRCTSH